MDGDEQGRSMAMAAGELRRQAEERLRTTTATLPQTPLTLAEAQRLVHELEVHRIELEMQNAELCEARNATDSALSRYTDLYDFAPVGYFALNSDGAILAVNLFGARMLKTERSRLIGSSFRLLVAGESRRDFDAFLRQVFKDQEKERCEVALDTTGSQPAFIQIEAISFCCGEECLFVAIDITERKLAVEALVISETRYRRLFESAKDVILIIDANTDWITDASPFLVDMLGYYREECLQKKLWEIGMFTDVDACKRTYSELRSSGYVHNKQLSLLAKDGTLVYAELVGNAYMVDRKRVIQCTIRDITERVKTQEALRDKERQMTQQCRMAAMGEMLGFIAHQWRQPLNHLGLNLQELTLARKLGNFTMGLLECNVDKAMGILQYLSRTIDDFMDFTRPEKEKCLFSVNEIVAKTVALIGELFKDQNIEILTDAAGNPEIRGYPNELSQVLLNILLNAKDAFGERKTCGARISIWSGIKDGMAVVTITDNAGGIDEGIIDKIFDAFFTTKGAGNGTGVGLFMSKIIIEKHMGGRLTVCNVGSGAEFRIEI